MKSTLYFLILLLPLIIIPAVFLLFPVQNIECKLSSGSNCPESFFELLNSMKNQPLIITDFESKITSHNTPAGYSLDKVTKNIPSTLKLTFVAEPVLMQITCLDCNGDLGIGIFRHILSNSDEVSDLPKFSLPLNNQEIFENDKLKAEYFEPLKLLTESLYKTGIVFQNGEWISKDEIRLNLSDHPVAIFNSEQITNQAIALDLIIKGDAITLINSDIKEIDLRYKMPVLRTAK